jgi:hypothetical protein
MSTNSLRAAASAALICLLFSNGSAFAMAAAAAGPGAGAASGAGSGAGNGGPPSAAVVLPNDTDRTPYWHFHKVQKAREACPIQFPRCRQDEVD